MTVPDLTAVELLRQHGCTAQCLLAGDDNPSCACECRGAWHGALAGTRVPGTARHRRPLPAAQAGPDLLDELQTLDPVFLASSPSAA